MAEEGTKQVTELLSESRLVGTSRISYTECHAAFARGRREGRISQDQVSRARRSLDDRWADLVVVGFDAAIAQRAGQMAYKYDLRALDAIHLASAALFAGNDLEETAVASWDSRLWEAASQFGFRMMPRARPG